jgi:hypothetical protein
MTAYAMLWCLVGSVMCISDWRGALLVLEIENGRIVELTFFLDVVTQFPRFGLPLVFQV